ncbi:MAG: sensor histidine kinase, partial [Salinibacter sp.]
DEVEVRADPMLDAVFENLVSNAVKYSEAGGQVWLRAYSENQSAVLEVEDTGIGMDEEKVEELFEPFRQASEGIARKYEGTGLGLAVTKEVVDQMEGSIEVETGQDEGTCFAVRLPRIQSPPSTATDLGDGRLGSSENES